MIHALCIDVVIIIVGCCAVDSSEQSPLGIFYVSRSSIRSIKATLPGLLERDIHSTLDERKVSAYTIVAQRVSASETKTTNELLRSHTCTYISGLASFHGLNTFIDAKRPTRQHSFARG